MKMVVSTSSSYADTCRAFLACYKKYWPQQPYEVVFLTNKGHIDVDAEVIYVKSDEPEYSRRLLTYLNDHNDDGLVLLMFADYLIHSVDHELVKHAEMLCRSQVARCQLTFTPKHCTPYSGQFCTIVKGSPYSLSLQPGIWNVSVLRKLIRPKENAWIMEMAGSRRTKKIKGLFLATLTDAIQYINYYIKGYSDHSLDWTEDNVPQDDWPADVKERHSRRKGV